MAILFPSSNSVLGKNFAAQYHTERLLVPFCEWWKRLFDIRKCWWYQANICSQSSSYANASRFKHVLDGKLCRNYQNWIVGSCTWCRNLKTCGVIYRAKSKNFLLDSTSNVYGMIGLIEFENSISETFFDYLKSKFFNNTTSVDMLIRSSSSTCVTNCKKSYSVKLSTRRGKTKFNTLL